jgi:glycolate oxidase FAD binding subunit
VLVEATLKLRPRVDVDRLVVARFDRLRAAGAAARAVLASDLIPSALELADGEALRRLGLGGGGALLIGLDGIAPQVDWEVAELARLLGPIGLGETTVLDGAARDDTWRALAGLGRPGHDRVAAVMKWAVLPTQIAELMEAGAAAAQRNGLVGALTAHAGVGIVTAVLAGGTNPNAVVSTLTEWRALVNRVDGHAMIEWAPLAVKERVAVWDAAGPTLRLMKGIKERLDPRGILNPGRFVGDI